MRYGIIGTGAIGGYYGAKLARAGQEVHFLFRSDYEYVKQHGLQVDSCDGSFHLDDINAYLHTEDMPKCDVVLVCLKSVNNGKLQSLLPPLLHDKAASKREQSDARPKVKTLVVLIQNGIGVEEDVQKMFPDAQLAAGLAFICSAKAEPGRVNHQCYGSINLANYSCKDEALMQTVVDEFRQAGIETGLVEYHEARWKKAVWNMPFNGMTVALHTQTDQLLKNPSTRQLIREQMMEVVSAAQHLGVKNLDAAFVDKMINMTDNMTPYSPSMRLDYDFHRRMEIYYLYTRPLEIAREAGCPMPKLEMLEAELRFLEG
jgi:2-dehydropantoate 2-reductase